MCVPFLVEPFIYTQSTPIEPEWNEFGQEWIAVGRWLRFFLYVRANLLYVIILFTEFSIHNSHDL